jgi:hypothetical protein
MHDDAFAQKISQTQKDVETCLVRETPVARETKGVTANLVLDLSAARNATQGQISSPTVCAFVRAPLRIFVHDVAIAERADRR